MKNEYRDIGGGYRFALHRVGASMMNPAGQSVYFQPGDDTAAILEAVEALDEIPDAKRGIAADMAFRDCFA